MSITTNDTIAKDLRASLAQRAEAQEDQPATLALVIERLAANPGVDVAKLEKIIELQERILHHEAKAAFDAAFAVMAPKIPTIDESGRIEVRGAVRSTYAPLEDIHEVIKPILAQHGFAMRHRTEWPDKKDGIIRVVGILSHREGHSEESAFEAGMDKSDYRTDVQSMGSTVSYGRRYTTLDLLNISTRRQDNDGATSGRPEPPEGYIQRLETLREAAMDGTRALESVWNKTPAQIKKFVVDYDKAAWDGLKRAAAEATRAATA